jgi:aryl-alcohol dehydrogenase-like predicted oxidoreductase
MERNFTYSEMSTAPDRTSQTALSRRSFLQTAAVTGVSAVMPTAAAALKTPATQAQANRPTASSDGSIRTLPNPIIPNFRGEYDSSSVPSFQVPKRPMGSTGLQVSILGMGGFHLGAALSQDVVNDMVAKALDHGINLFDNAWEYQQGAGEERVGIALKGKRDQAVLVTGVCTYGRKKDIAMRMLEDSLTRLQTDHVDIWQVHDVIYYNDPELACQADGVLEALTAARQQGKVRFVGFTGHKNPSIHLDMLNRGFHFDTIQMPINPFDPSFRSFETNVLPVAVRKCMGVFSIKSMSGSGESIVRGALTPTEALFYAMSVPGVSATVSGMESMEVLDQNLEILSNFKPLAEEQMAALREHGRQFNDGRYELYKTTVKYESDLGRAQHGYPSSMDLPA